MATEATFSELLEQIRGITTGGEALPEKLAQICRLLEQEIPHYSWVGFYLTDPERTQELVLGPFVGEPTEHVRIPFGRGICGQAAETRNTFVVQDVTAESNYLSCSPTVRSEIVVPILKAGAVLGELDIDSHRLAPFTPADRVFLEQVCQLVAEIF